MPSFSTTSGQPLTRIVCSRCGSSVATDVLNHGSLVCALVGWELLDDRVIICTGCQWREGRVPNVARRLRILADLPR